MNVVLVKYHFFIHYIHVITWNEGLLSLPLFLCFFAKIRGPSSIPSFRQRADSFEHIWGAPEMGVPQELDGLYWKIPLKWMI
jgi:hypothetical protein